MGRKSPTTRTPDLEKLAVGQSVMTIFDLVEFEKNVHLTLRLRARSGFPPLAVSYLVSPTKEGCRLVVKLALELQSKLGSKAMSTLGAGGDWIMMRRQLLNLRALAEREEAAARL